MDVLTGGKTRPPVIVLQIIKFGDSSCTWISPLPIVSYIDCPFETASVAS